MGEQVGSRRVLMDKDLDGAHLSWSVLSLAHSRNLANII
jgi:hypothetical protein